MVRNPLSATTVRGTKSATCSRCRPVHGYQAPARRRLASKRPTGTSRSRPQNSMRWRRNSDEPWISSRSRNRRGPKSWQPSRHGKRRSRAQDCSRPPAEARLCIPDPFDPRRNLAGGHVARDNASTAMRITMTAYAFLQHRLKTARRKKKWRTAATNTLPAVCQAILELIALRPPQRSPDCRRWICNARGVGKRLRSGTIHVTPAARRAIGALTHFGRTAGCGQSSSVREWAA